MRYLISKSGHLNQTRSTPKKRVFMLEFDTQPKYDTINWQNASNQTFSKSNSYYPLEN